MQKVTDEVKVMNEEDHFKNSNEDIVELYQTVKSKILDMDSNIEIKPYVVFISFKMEKHIVDVALQQSQLKIWLNLLKENLMIHEKWPEMFLKSITGARAIMKYL